MDTHFHNGCRNIYGGIAFLTHDEKSLMQKGDAFEFQLENNVTNATVMPGDDYAVSPVIANNATVYKYAFIESTIPSFNGKPLYILVPAESWMLMESASGENDLVYAYVSNGLMTELIYNESTVPLIVAITMRNISNGDYVAVEDININVKEYVIGVGMVSADSAET